MPQEIQESTLQDDKRPIGPDDKQKSQKEQEDSLSAVGKGYTMGISVLAISSQMLIIPLIGIWVDRRLGTGILCAALGLLLGMYSSISQLIRLGNQKKSE